MKWVLIVVGSLAALGALLAIIGSLLPKGHTASLSVRFKQPPEAVWQAITDFAGQASWREDLKVVEKLPDQNGHTVWKEVGKNGMAMPLETVEMVPPRRLVRKIADPKMPFGGRWVYEISPAEGGCTLTITENGEVYNPVFRLFSRFMDMSATIKGYLRALGKKFGEPVRV